FPSCPWVGHSETAMNAPDESRLRFPGRRKKGSPTFPLLDLYVPPGEAIALRGDADPRLIATDRGRERAHCERGLVVLLRKMRGDEMAKVGALEVLHHRGGGAVVEMAEASGDALLEAGGIRPVPQHVEVVVALDH